MMDLQITDVRVLPGDSAFLIDDGKTAILYDTGFAFTGEKMVENIRTVLKDRTLDYIFLSHSHYDHVNSAPYILKHYPDAIVVAGEYAKKIFEKPSAREKMRELDKSYAATCGVQDYEDYIDELKVDISVKDGEEIRCGDMTFTVVNLPGHTKCSIGFYLKEKKFLLGSETLGVYFGGDSFLPFYLVGYKMALDAFKKVRKLDLEGMLLPHYGVIGKEETSVFLECFETSFIRIAEKIKAILQEGGSTQDALDYYENTYYTDNVKPTYPIDAFHLNTSIMIELVKKELLGI